MPGLVAQPWWVNAMLLAPLLAYFSWRRAGVPLPARTLVISGVFAASFAFLHGTVPAHSDLRTWHRPRRTRQEVG
jgi:hypothetical protein